MKAAMMAVIAPMMAITSQEREGNASTPMESWTRTIMYTPAATIVAAWIRAETGVGPSMASGSHTCSGNWADLPTAPQNRHSTVMFSRVSLMPAGISIRLKLSVLVSAQRVRMPIRKPKSPRGCR